MRGVLTPRLWLLAIAHFTSDAYSSFFPPLLPLLVAKLDLSLTQVGWLVALLALASSFSQPLFGWLSDRVRRPWFVAFGPLVGAVFFSAVGLATSFAGLALVLMLGGLGAAAFHPQGAILASGLSARRGLAMSFFVTGGTLGFAVGPLLAVWVVGSFGLERSWLAATPGLLLAPLLLAWFARVAPRSRAAPQPPRLSGLRPVAKSLTLLYLATVCRSAASYGFMVFLPLHLARRGYAVATGGQLVALYLFLGATGAFLGGWLSDRWGGRRVMVTSFLGAAPLYVAFLMLPDLPGLMCLMAGSFVLQSSLPLSVVMGQELSPAHASTISSLLMGAAWGLGALVIGPVGWLADHHGIVTALLALSSVLAVGFACSFALPDVRRPVGAADLAEPATGIAGR